MAVTILTTHGYIFGHACHWDEASRVYRYDDDNTVVAGWGGKQRSCPACGELPAPEGYDPCIGYIPGASASCCGHGVERGYVQWPAVVEREAKEEPRIEIRASVLRQLVEAADDDIDRYLKGE